MCFGSHGWPLFNPRLPCPGWASLGKALLTCAVPPWASCSTTHILLGNSREDLEYGKEGRCLSWAALLLILVLSLTLAGPLTRLR